METYNDVLTNSLRNKIKKLITLYEENKSKNQSLESKNKELTERVFLLERKLADSEKKYNTIKLGKTILATDDNSHEARIKVNRIVREIDKCIALLNR